jgi:hypothetical protein
MKWYTLSGDTPQRSANCGGVIIACSLAIVSPWLQVFVVMRNGCGVAFQEQEKCKMLKNTGEIAEKKIVAVAFQNATLQRDDLQRWQDVIFSLF